MRTCMRIYSLSIYIYTHTYIYIYIYIYYYIFIWEVCTTATSAPVHSPEAGPRAVSTNSRDETAEERQQHDVPMHQHFERSAACIVRVKALGKARYILRNIYQ